jgi:hypothetical protein
MTEDTREAKLPRWAQDKLKMARQVATRSREQRELALLDKPTEGSDMWLEVGSDYEKFIGLGHRASVRVPIGEKRYANGDPVDYIEVEAGRVHRYGEGAKLPQPVTFVRVRGAHGLLVAPDTHNVVNVYPTA